MSGPGTTRRLFVRDGLVTLAAFGAAPALLGRLAEAAAPRRDTVLVTVFLRGGLDALAAAPPLDEPRLARSRPHLALSATGDAASRGIDLDGRVGLHPALAPLLPWWRHDRLAVVHGIGQLEATRSHFDAQRNLESGAAAPGSTDSGWLGRAVTALPAAGDDVTAVARCHATPQSLRGAPSVLVIPSLDTLALPIRRGSPLEEALEASWRGFPDPRLRRAGEAAEAALDLAERIRRQRGSGPRAPAGGPLGEALTDVACLIRADVGLRVACVESGGWDTHARQGAARGAFAGTASDLAAALDGFLTALAEHRERVVVLTVTEFGRTVAENGSGGTDHGRASCFFVLGDRVRGGRVYGSVPELAPENLEDGRDLPVRIDYREVLAGVAGRHLGIRDLAPVFPGWSGKPLKLLKKA